jgi:hypothetical protein
MSIFVRPPYNLNRINHTTAMNLLKSILALAASCAALSTTANAALVITDSSIVGSTYTYDVTFDEMVADNLAVLYADMNSYSGIYLRLEGSGVSERHCIVTNNNVNTASIVYEFDFSGITNWQATSFDLRDTIYINGTTYGSITTFYKFGDTGEWIEFNKTNGGSQIILSTFTTGDSIELPSGVVKIYYKVEFQSTSGNFSSGRFQWNRSGPASSSSTFLFALNVTPVPEPATAGIFITACILGATLILRKIMKR